MQQEKDDTKEELERDLAFLRDHLISLGQNGARLNELVLKMAPEVLSNNLRPSTSKAAVPFSQQEETEEAIEVRGLY